MWYAVAVRAGREQASAALMARLLCGGVARECFSPAFELPARVGGSWVTRTRPLLPGYVIADADDPARLDGALRESPVRARVLRAGGAYPALSEDDVAWIGAFTSPGRRTMGVSGCVVEGGRASITRGPLAGRQGWVERIDLHKRCAYLKIDMFGREVRTKAGIEILASRPGASGA